MKNLIERFENLMVSITFAEEGILLDPPFEGDQVQQLQPSVKHSA